MEPWKIVFDEAAFQLFTASSVSERSDWAVRPFLITYWLDSFVSEIRIVNIEKIRY